MSGLWRTRQASPYAGGGDAFRETTAHLDCNTPVPTLTPVILLGDSPTPRPLPSSHPLCPAPPSTESPACETSHPPPSCRVLEGY